MIKNIVLLVLLFTIILISGCTTTQPLTSPFTSSEKMMQTPSLNFYGKILDYTIDEDLIKLKIQSEIVNYELNRTELIIEVNKSTFKEYNREIVDYSSKSFNYSEENVATRMWYSHENYYIYDINKLEPKTFYYFKFKGYNQDGTTFTSGFFGQYLDYNLDKNAIDVYTIWNNAEGKSTIYLTNTGKFEWEELNDSFVPRNNEFVSAQRPWRVSDLIKENNYVIYLEKYIEVGPWDRIVISENITKYKEEGSFYHENDLMIDQRIDIEEGEPTTEPGVMRTGRVFPTFIISEGKTELKIDLINKQDNDINYLIKDAKIVDENILQPWKSHWEEPSYEERLEDSIIESCEVKYDSQENMISANSTKELSFEVNCDDIECRDWYISDVYGNTTTDCKLILWGQIEFVDELGNKHIIPEKGMLKQMLTTGQRTKLVVEYSKEISSKEEFFIYADYKDIEDNIIHSAQIELKFSGVSGIFRMRYDDSLEKYKFLWSTFYEHAPPFKGTYEFTVTASKTGYEMQKEESYIFTITP